MTKHIAPLNIILLGDPASGKGTQAARLVKKLGLYDLDMGREIRKPKIKKQFDYATTTGIGKLTPTTIVRSIFTEVTHKVPAHKGILFNGTPKMINEAKLVKKLLKETGRVNPIVIYITLPEKETIARMNIRRREDDTLRALKNRRAYYKAQITQVVTFFKKQYTVKSVSGMGTKREVAQRIDTIISWNLGHQKK